MSLMSRTASLFLGLLSLSFVLSAQVTRTGSISGFVTIDGKPAPGIAVVVNNSEWANETKDAPPPKAVTDQSGRYVLRNLPPGKYEITASAPGFVDARKSSEGNRRSSITLAEGEAIDKVDFPLKRGGVIAGRITDEDGKPVIEEALVLMCVEEANKNLPVNCRQSTDDQGNSRCSGLARGKYLGGAGVDPTPGAVGWNGSFYERLWYPGTKDENSAKVVEVTVGNEATEIDWKLRRRKKGFAVSGRVIEADTGKPVPHVSVLSSPVGENGRVTMFYGGMATSADGEFKLQDVTPGKYGAVAFTATWKAFTPTRCCC
ncbi:MAG: carboxypeptidase regulatory-like domain-containing protein [Blastocatellia bacterium]